MLEVRIRCPVALEIFRDQEGGERTSFRVIGFSSRVKCVNFVNVFRGSRSASSDKLFEVKTRVVKFGRDEARVD